MVHRETAFDDVFDSQKIFRVLMESMSRPGSIHRFAPIQYAGTPNGFNPFVLSVLKTLCDTNVTFAIVDEPCRDWTRYVERNTATRITSPRNADYVVCLGNRMPDCFPLVKRGTLEYPERGATVLLVVESIRHTLSGEMTRPCGILRMEGPGIKGTRVIALSNLDVEYIHTLARSNTHPPMGIDTFFVDTEGNISGAPRSARMEVIQWDT
jgi:alpha-D-ribose 1-methylphosphonate 5-triphosphate synthase subunit PhnH